MARAATRAASNGRPSQPKPGSLAQKEMAQAIAERVVGLETSIFRSEVAMHEAGKSENDLALFNGQRVVDDEGEHLTYRQHSRSCGTASPTSKPPTRP